MKQTDIEIRDADRDDYAGICALIDNRDELFRVYPRGRYPFTVEQVLELAQVRKSLSVAVHGAKIVAFANLYDLTPGEYAFIGNVVVDRGFRNQGLGKAIVKHMLNTVSNVYQLPEVRISVFSENTAAILLYAGFGFEPYAVEQRSDPGGRRVALVHMKKIICKNGDEMHET